MSVSWLAPVSAYIASEPRFQPEQELRLIIDEQRGWVEQTVAAALETLLPPGQIQRHATHIAWQLQGADYAARSRELQAAVEALCAQGLVKGWRNESMVLRDSHGMPWAAMERSAFRTFGLTTVSAHLNALVLTPDGARMWVATRSASKAVDPGCLDNLVGGGVTGLESLPETLCREAVEEAGLVLHRPPAPQACLHVLRRSRHGVQDEQVHVHEAWLPAGFRPENRDGEVADTACLSLDEVVAAICAGRFTRDAALVILYGLTRQYFFGADTGAIVSLLTEHGVLG